MQKAATIMEKFSKMAMITRTNNECTARGNQNFKETSIFALNFAKPKLLQVLMRDKINARIAYDRSLMR